jgi:hypothetical protein
MHIFRVSITTVQSLKSVSLKAWEDLFTRSRYRLEPFSLERDSYAHIWSFRAVIVSFIERVSFPYSIVCMRPRVV